MVLLSIWGIREVHPALKGLIFMFSVVKSTRLGVESGHHSSIASVLYHHRSAMM